jgi:hypothetical protein
VELVVRGTGGTGGGKRVQIGRARTHQWGPLTEDRFLAVLAATCNVKAAYEAAGMSKGSAYTHRKRWPDFARRWKEAVEEGYVRIELALLENGANLFSRADLPPEVPIRGMTAAQAIHVLHMHKKEVRGIGKAPGVRWRPPPTMAEHGPAIRRKIAIVIAGRGVGAAEKARAEADYARRRPGGGCECGCG